MDEKRMGEIAVARIRYQMRSEGFRLTPHYSRELGNIAKATGIPLDELKEFDRILVEELVEDTFR